MSSQVTEFVSVILEIRPRLKCVNAFMKFNKSLSICPLIILEEELIKIVIDKRSLTIPCKGFINVANSLTNINFNKHFLVFRFSSQNIVENTGCFKTELLLNTVESIESLRNKPLLVKNINYIIYCINCEKALTNAVKFKRILPLPSDSSNFSEWFCHNHNNIQSFNFSPKVNDIFYSHCYLHLHVSNVPFIKSSGKIFVCKYCLNWIGVRYDKHTLRLWHNTVNFVNNTTSVKTLGLSDIFQSIRSILKKLTTSVRLIISCQTYAENIDNLLLWVLEKKLQILYIDSSNIKPLDVAKVLFRFIKCDDPIFTQWNSDCFTNKISVSKPMFIELLKHLHHFNKLFPEEFAKSNDFLISYLLLYDQFL